MSFDRGRKALNLEMTDRIPQVEFIDHDDFTLKIAGVDTRDPVQRPQAWPALAHVLDLDMAWNIVELPISGRFTKLGHAEWSETDAKDAETFCPFTSIEDVLAFDPVAEWGIMEHDEMVKAFQANLDWCKLAYPDTLYPGGRYYSLFSSCIHAFGWEMFLFAARYDEAAFARVLDGFAERNLAQIHAWLDTDLKFFLMHDDIVWTSGPVFPPEWYRKYIFPHYRRFWEPIHAAGKKIVFCADGNFNEFIGDIARAGADGFIFEPSTSLETIVRDYGQTHVIVGNADCRVLQFGAHADIRKEVERCVRLGRECPGYFMCATNHLPNGIPTENVQYYFDVFNELRNRE